MPTFWDQFKKFFGEAEQSSPSQPLIHEVITRTEAEKKDYDHWKETLVRRRLLDWLSNQYSIFQVLPRDIDEALDFLNTPSSKGFVIHFHKTQYSKRDVTFLFDYLKERVLALNYKIQISDTRTFNRPNWVETINRHYLKPRKTFREGQKLQQGFGNITIDMTLRDDQVYHLRFRATIYKDHQFEEAQEFGELMKEVLL